MKGKTRKETIYKIMEDKLEKLEMELYQKLCSSCPNSKKCHEDCEYCDDFYANLEYESNKDN